MSYDISLNIGGELADAEAARRLVITIYNSEMGPTYHENSFDDTNDILDHLASGDAKPVNLAGRGDEDMAEAIIESCRDAGLSYNVSIGYGGEDDYRFQRAWSPGMAEEASAGAADADHHVSLSDLDKAIEQAVKSGDLAPVVALRDATRAAHVEPGKLVIAEDVKARLSALDEDEWDEELTETPPTP